MIIKGLGEFKLTGAINECEPLLRILQIRTFSYKPHMMVTYEGGSRYRFCFYDEEDPAVPHPIVMWSDMTLEQDEKKYIKICEWY